MLIFHILFFPTTNNIFRAYFSPWVLKFYLDELNNNNLTVETFKSCTPVEFPELRSQATVIEAMD
jgi:hypothetical protein